jgi:superfamily II DNA or RNA helicase
MVAMLRPPSTVASWVAERVRAHVPVVSLRDYQDAAVDHVAHAIGTDGKRRVVVVLPTGSGKTVVFGALAHAWLSDSMGRVLVLAHRDELIQQAAAKLSLWLPRHLIGIVKAQRDETDAPVVVASVQTLKNEKRLARVGQFGLIVIDEAHHASAASYRTILRELGAFRADGPVVVGVTATPKRADGVRLDDVFEHIAYAKTYTEMVAARYLAPVESRVFDLVEHAMGKPKLGLDGDYSEGWLEGVMLRANAPDKIVEAWKAEAYDRPTIVFTPTVSVAKAVAEAFNGAGVSAAWVSGAMPTQERRVVLAGLAAGRIRVVANCAVLTEGFDEPSISCIVIGRPTMNESLYIQMVGRGTRLHPESGKASCLILDMVGCADQLRLDAVVELGGRKLSDRREAAEQAERGETDVPFSTVDGALVGRTVKAVKPVCRWVALGDGCHALSLLGDWVTVEADDVGTHRVIYRPKRGKAVPEHEGLDLDWAKAAGEGIARREGAHGAMHRGARWLDRPLSEKAYAFGQSAGFPVTTETTAWQFTQMQAERQHLRWHR